MSEIVTFTTDLGYSIVWCHPKLTITDLRDGETQDVILKSEGHGKDMNTYFIKYTSVNHAEDVPCAIEISWCGPFISNTRRITISPHDTDHPVWAPINGYSVHKE